VEHTFFIVSVFFVKFQLSLFRSFLVLLILGFYLSHSHLFLDFCASHNSSSVSVSLISFRFKTCVHFVLVYVLD